MNKTKIVYICESLGGGVRKHLIDILQHLDKNKYEIHFIHGTNRMDNVFKSEMKRMPIIKFYEVSEMDREINIKNDLVSLKKVIKILKSIKPDIVHCHSSKAGVIGRIAAKTVKVKNVYYTPHGYMIQSPQISQRKKWFFGTIEKILGRYFTTKNIHVSKGEAAIARQNKLISDKKSLVIYNGMNFPDYQLNKTKDKEIFNIITIARMDEQKNPWDSIKMAEALINEFPHVNYTYIGDGKYYDEILKYVTSKDLQEKIVLPGFKDNPLEYLVSSDLFLLTSLYEGLPYSLIEAIAYKVPLFASDVTGNNEIVIENYNGLLYNINNIDEGIVKLKNLLLDKDRLTEMSENAYNHFLEYFTFSKMMQKYDELYSKQ